MPKLSTWALVLLLTPLASRAGPPPLTIGDYVLLLQKDVITTPVLEKHGAGWGLAARSGKVAILPGKVIVDVPNGYVHLEYGFSRPLEDGTMSEERGHQLEAALFTTHNKRTLVLVSQLFEAGDLRQTDLQAFEFKGSTKTRVSLGLEVKAADLIDEAWAATPAGKKELAELGNCGLNTDYQLPQRGTTVTAFSYLPFVGTLLPDDPNTDHVVRCTAMFDTHEKFDTIAFEWNQTTGTFTKGKKSRRNPAP